MQLGHLKCLRVILVSLVSLSKYFLMKDSLKFEGQWRGDIGGSVIYTLFTGQTDGHVRIRCHVGTLRNPVLKIVQRLSRTQPLTNANGSILLWWKTIRVTEHKRQTIKRQSIPIHVIWRYGNDYVFACDFCFVSSKCTSGQSNVKS